MITYEMGEIDDSLCGWFKGCPQEDGCAITCKKCIGYKETALTKKEALQKIDKWLKEMKS